MAEQALRNRPRQILNPRRSSSARTSSIIQALQRKGRANGNVYEARRDAPFEQTIARLQGRFDNQRSSGAHAPFLTRTTSLSCGKRRLAAADTFCFAPTAVGGLELTMRVRLGRMSRDRA